MKIRQKGNKYEIQYRCKGYGSAFSERFDSEEAANLRVAQIALEKKLGSFRPPAKYGKNYEPTVEELLREFVDLYGVNHWGDSFLSTSQHRIDHYINPLIGTIKVKDITPHLLECFYDQLQQTPAIIPKGHKDTGKCVSHSVIERIHSLLKNAFNRAIRWGYISTNPALTAEVPQYEKGERAVWPAETVQKALRVCEEPNLKLAMLLAMGCSMRIGEILGLTWDCVDIRPERIEDQDAQLHVNKELKRCQKDALEKLKQRNRDKLILEFPELKKDCTTKLVLKVPKTASSIRNIFIPTTVAVALVEAQKRQQELKAMLGEVYEDYNLVITHDNGRPVEAGWMLSRLQRLIKQNDLPPVVFHSLRHSSTSVKLEISHGNIKAVQGDTGHAQADMVTNVYAHSNNTERKKLARLVEQQFFNRIEEPAESSPDEKTTKIIGLLKEKPEVADTFLTLLSAMVS